MAMSAIHENLNKVRSEITLAIQRAKRPLDSVTLLAVSKTFDDEAVRAAYAAGQLQFGENYVQEAVDKIQALQDIREALTWHFIGPLQSNKTKDVAEHFDWVHTIDRLKIAQRLNDQRPQHLHKLQVCVQVNISQEDSKSGISPHEAKDFCLALLDFPRLELRGLMSIPAAKLDAEDSRADHRSLAELFKTIAKDPATQNQAPLFNTLSMGMSSDLAVAIEEGSTIVRIGTAIFGKRVKNDIA